MKLEILNVSRIQSVKLMPKTLSSPENSLFIGFFSILFSLSLTD